MRFYFYKYTALYKLLTTIMGEVSTGDHQLWVNLSALGDGNVFAVLPQLWKNMLSEDMTDLQENLMDIILPSNGGWQDKIYYKLVEKQRLADTSADEAMLDPLLREDRLPKLHDWNIVPKTKLVICESRGPSAEKKPKPPRGIPPITWTVGDIAKAGCLLTSPPLPTTFDDEQEMRRVYTLIYDVFRYKNVLMIALNDIRFFQVFPKLTETAPHVWLLFYDLYHRGFKKRETRVAAQVPELFRDSGLTFAENALWSQRVKLAAAVARLRIKYAALSLGDLLPPHLKDERVTEQAKKNPVTCWVNSFKFCEGNKVVNEIEKAFGLKMVSDIKHLSKNTFKWDRHCPQIIAFHSTMRANLARSTFVKDHLLIVQDRSFCLGPATFEKLLSDFELTGTVIQTHVNSPRTTAYLATLLSQNEKIKKLMAFSAGKRKTEYENYFRELGMTNIVIFSDRLIDTPPDANYMEEVVAVFATPPNSYSAVTDPIDLVCSRGGDLSMLEVLTESNDNKEARERVAAVLEEQKKTLSFSMSRPQIQFVLYETHSELEAENSSMVTKTIKEVNKIAKVHHASLQGSISVGVSASVESTTAVNDTNKEINNNEKQALDDNIEIISLENQTALNTNSLINRIENESEDTFLEHIKVPDTDLFDLPSLPSLCPSEICKQAKKEGCYLALLKRKEIICLDDKYMIQMAENRGLFGSNTTTETAKSKSTRSVKKRQEKEEKTSHKPKKRVKEAEIERIAAPTHTFLRHTKQFDEVDSCRKAVADDTGKKSTIYKRWWVETTRHILSIKSSLIRHKLLPSDSVKHFNVKTVVNKMQSTKCRVDEIAARSNAICRYPIIPKLRLTRSVVPEKVQISMSVKAIVFPDSVINYSL